MNRSIMSPLVFKYIPCFQQSLVGLIFLGAGALASAQTVLITEEESRFPNAQVLSTRAITRGPAIKLVTPTDVPAKSFAMKFDLEARGGSKLDHNSLKVEYLKQPVVDLTARFKPGLQGNHLELHQAKVPEGHHAIKVSIKDSEGREGSHVFQLSAK